MALIHIHQYLLKTPILILLMACVVNVTASMYYILAVLAILADIGMSVAVSRFLTVPFMSKQMPFAKPRQNVQLISIIAKYAIALTYVVHIEAVYSYGIYAVAFIIQVLALGVNIKK